MACGGTIGDISAGVPAAFEGENSASAKPWYDRRTLKRAWPDGAVVDKKNPRRSVPRGRGFRGLGSHCLQAMHAGAIYGKRRPCVCDGRHIKFD